MEKIVKKFITHSLSTGDVLNICNNAANVRTISSLKNVNHIDEILLPYDACLILYDRKNGDAGHWICITRSKGIIEYFCPYAYKPDSILKHIPNKPYLTKLLKESGNRVIYNTKRLQKLSNNVSVCGRYCGMRILLKDTSLDYFIKMFINNKNYDPDFWVTLLTLFCET